MTRQRRKPSRIQILGAQPDLRHYDRILQHGREDPTFFDISGTYKMHHLHISVLNQEKERDNDVPQATRIAQRLRARDLEQTLTFRAHSSTLIRSCILRSLPPCFRLVYKHQQTTTKTVVKTN